MSIKEQLEAIRALYATATDEKEISLIQKDILLEKTRELYNKLFQLNAGTSKTKITGKNDIPEPVTGIQPEELVIEVDTIDEENKVESTDINQVSSERANHFSASKDSIQTATLFDEPDKDSSVVNTVSDEKSNSSSSIHQKMSNQTKDNSVVEKIKKNPVADLKKSIGINEKFSFINELYAGNLQRYSESIDLLNKAENKDNALSGLLQIAESRNWNKESNTYIALKELVERRFS